MLVQVPESLATCDQEQTRAAGPQGTGLVSRLWIMIYRYPVTASAECAHSSTKWYASQSVPGDVCAGATRNTVREKARGHGRVVVRSTPSRRGQGLTCDEIHSTINTLKRYRDENKGGMLLRLGTPTRSRTPCTRVKAGYSFKFKLPVSLRARASG
eukprot:2231072-Rhodomonas_salina.1